MSPPSPLPYAPRRQKPLSLWNPLDYGILLYWIFFFSQALRWYVEAFGRLPVETSLWQAIRQDTVQRDLALQGTALALGIPFTAALLLSGLDIPPNFWKLAVGVASGVRGGVAEDVAFGVAVILSGLRADAFLFTLLPSLLPPSQGLAIPLQRYSPIPISRLRQRLVQRLQEDWAEGLHACEGLLRYSLQFIPVIIAVRQTLERLPPLRFCHESPPGAACPSTNGGWFSSNRQACASVC
jgi:hypothetical protein